MGVELHLFRLFICELFLLFQEEEELNEVLDTLLNRGSSTSNAADGRASPLPVVSQTAGGDLIMDAVDDDGDGLLLDMTSIMDDSNHHDSQMITQEISDDDDGEDNTQG